MAREARWNEEAAVALVEVAEQLADTRVGKMFGHPALSSWFPHYDPLSSIGSRTTSEGAKGADHSPRPVTPSASCSGEGGDGSTKEPDDLSS